MEVLSEVEWTARRAAHAARVRAWTGPHHERRARGEKHPVLDFLWSYYSHRPSRMERWHPGPGVVLAGDAAEEYLRWPAYRRVPGGVALDVAGFARERASTVAFVHRLLAATASRRPRLGCFGLHEWAMVYRSDRVRHEAWPLRLGARGTDAVVEAQRVRCSHFDAFRFFTPEARPLNTLQPTREEQVRLEQPGCLHVSMDLFKWSYKLDPATPSELLADCFDLALRVRELDMRASPYDLSALGYRPIRIETAEGRAEYVERQAAFAAEAAPLRAALLDLTTALLAASDNTATLRPSTGFTC
ncbi:3-methyladenine DNA glycosylase [Saccharothrix obliqua]|uniref:3-methyladenine DNA glycosylase n=1 Tax=Saccharothrix obliqua TaxID=2861747 RepID=UPI001C5F40F9|nr:3-methyladenine DNA glycosylase [Saccharothrix obliqua]MBW4721086.1 3-methyladenine DNA glycosylase [Saccharothrix obliqua]